MYITVDFVKENREKNSRLVVKQLQALLNLLGEKLLVDGAFGAKSTQAVKTFQSSQNLKVDGQVGSQTWVKLYSSSLEHANSLNDLQESYEEITLNTENSDLVLWAQSMFYLIDNTTKTTAKFDEALEERIISFQDSFECTDNGCMDFETWQELIVKVKEEIERVSSCILTDADISQKAEENDLSPAAVQAVVKVESNGRGFRRDGSLKILFEGHIFWKELDKVDLNPHNYVAGNEDIVYRSATYDYYAPSLQYGRLNKAKKIHETAALKSASYGMFQIMGFNHKTAGFDTVNEFVESLKVSEMNQLEAFLTFVKNTKGCYEALKNKDWSRFARIYNGPAYKKNQYDSKMAKQYSSSKLTKGIHDVMDEEAYTAFYALELEKAFYEFDE